MMKIIRLGQCCAMSNKRPLRCTEPATTERGGRPVCMAHSRRLLKPSEVAAVTPAAERRQAARQVSALETAKRLKSEIYWRRSNLLWRTRMSWYKRVIIDNEITCAALAKEARKPKGAIAEAINKIDRSIRRSLRLPWPRPEITPAADLELIRVSFDERLRAFYGDGVEAH
jgi:hypothetical protein